MSGGRQNLVVKSGPVERKLTLSKNISDSRTQESTVIIKIVENCLTSRIGGETGNIVEVMAEWLHNAILTAFDKITTPAIELAVMSLKASSGWNAAKVAASPQLGQHIGITASFKNLSDGINTFNVLNVQDETQDNILDKVSELSVPVTEIDRQSHTHHCYA